MGRLLLLLFLFLVFLWWLVLSFHNGSLGRSTGRPLVMMVLILVMVMIVIIIVVIMILVVIILLLPFGFCSRQHRREEYVPCPHQECLVMLAQRVVSIRHPLVLF